MNEPRSGGETPPPSFHQPSESLHFWVDLPAAAPIGAMLPRRALFHRFGGSIDGSDAVAVYEAHRAEIDAAVVRRVAAGSIEPVMLRESDLPISPR